MCHFPNICAAHCMCKEVEDERRAQPFSDRLEAAKQI